MKFVVNIKDGINSKFEIINASSSHEALFLARVKYPEFYIDDDIYVEAAGLKEWFSERGVFL